MKLSPVTARQLRPPRRDALAATVAGGTVTGGLLGMVALIALLASFSWSLGGCTLLSSVITAPEKNGLGIATNTSRDQVLSVDSSAGLLDVITGSSITQQVAVGGETTDAAYLPGDAGAVVTDTAVGSSAGYLAVVRLPTGTVAQRIRVGSGPTGVAVSPDGADAYVSDTGYLGAGNIDVVDLATGSVVDTIAVGRQPAGLALNAQGTELYVAIANLYGTRVSPAESPGSVDVISTATDQVVGSVQVQVAPLLLALTAAGSTLAVANYGTSDLTLVDTATLAATTVPLPHGPGFAVAFSPGGTTVYVTGGDSPLLEEALGSEPLVHPQRDLVTAVDIGSGATLTYTVPDDPTGITVAPDGDVYVAQGTSTTVVRIDPDRHRLVRIGVADLAPPTRGRRP